MTVSILAFGVARDILGNFSIALNIDERLSIETLKSQLEEEFPRLKQLSSFMIAVNGEYAKPGTMINASDEIAIIPPVSGG